MATANQLVHIGIELFVSRIHTLKDLVVIASDVYSVLFRKHDLELAPGNGTTARQSKSLLFPEAFITSITIDCTHSRIL